MVENVQTIELSPLFITGMWRSGTTLISRMINNHPEFDGLLEMKPSYEMPLWLSREADFEQPEPVADNLVPLDFDSC